MEKRCCLVAVSKGQDPLFQNRIEEVQALVEAIDDELVFVLTQNLDKDLNTYIGAGKVEELNHIIEEHAIDRVLTLDDLSASQHRNLEALIGITLIDRTQLILEIFESRAQSTEAKLQVQVAYLRYLLPRLSLRAGFAGRQQGGSLRNKGAGEKAIALKLRSTKSALHQLEEQLKVMEKSRETQRILRSKQEGFTVAMVGYTNAGKSSLMNALLTAMGLEQFKSVTEKNRLFETITTASRGLSYQGKNIVLIDTVGFVSDLPTQLIKAFRSTLEEVKQADLLIHVVDGSHPSYLHQEWVTEETLRSMDVSLDKVLKVYNKADLFKQEGLCVSAKTGEGIQALIDRINHRLDALKPSTDLIIPFEEIEILNAIKKRFKSSTIQEDENGYWVHLPYVIDESDPLNHYRRKV